MAIKLAMRAYSETMSILRSFDNISSNTFLEFLLELILIEYLRGDNVRIAEIRLISHKAIGPM